MTILIPWTILMEHCTLNRPEFYSRRSNSKFDHFVLSLGCIMLGEIAVEYLRVQ